jgi:outer membrane immunogenic protein
MKRSFLAAAFCGLLFASQPGAAADLPVKGPLYAPEPIATWTGPYLGVHLGYGWYDAQDQSLLPLIAPAVYNGQFRGSGFLLGIQGGYDHQFGNFVLGMVGDLSWSDMSGNKTIIAGILNVPHAIEYFGTARVRAGFVLPNQSLLLYGTVGVAYMHTTAAISIPIVPISFPASTDRIGLAYGLGAEWRLRGDWSLAFEWLHLAMGRANVAFQLPIGGGIGVSIPVNLSADIVRAMLNRRF